MISKISANEDQTHSFLLLPLTLGNYTVTLQVASSDPAVSFHSNFTLLARPRLPLQTHIGQALLDLALVTGNDTLLNSAIHVGNWLYAHRIEVGSYYAWNGDPNCTVCLLPGYVMATVKRGRYFLNLFRATGEWSFLDYAVRAAHFLGINATAVPGGQTWSLHQNGVAEAAEAGRFLLEIDKELLTDYFHTSTVDDVASYLISIANKSGSTVNWFNSPGLTQVVSCFLAVEGSIPSALYAYWACNWLESKVNTPSWLASLSPSLKPESPYTYYTETALAGVGQTLVFLNDVSNLVNELKSTADRMVELAYLTSYGTNWREPTWTTNVTKLVRSMNLDYGAAGVAIALAEAFRVIGNQTYLDYALDAGTWLANCIPILDDPEVPVITLAEPLADVITSMVYVHSILPVFTLGYFVDPIVSLNKSWFILTAYAMSLGWYAYGVNLTVDLPGTFLLSSGETETREIGTIPEPSVVIASWNISLEISPYGEFVVAVDGDSENAGSASINATVVVTDLGVTRIKEEETASAVSLSVARGIQDKLYTIGEDVILPIRVDYYDGTPAINASVQVGGFGTAIVNGLGYAYMPVTVFEPGTVEIPIYLRYDKWSGITKGTRNITVTLTFTSLEVYDVTASSSVSFVGQPVVITGKVRYRHDHSPAAGAIVSVNGLFNVTADESGVFSFSVTEVVAASTNYTLVAYIDGSNKVILPTLWQTVTIHWISLLNPYTVILVSVTVTAVIVGIAVLWWRRMRVVRSQSTSDSSSGPAESSSNG